MRLTYVKDDNLVIVDGIGYKGEYTLKHFNKDDVHAIQHYAGISDFEMVPVIDDELKELIDKYHIGEVKNLHTQWIEYKRQDSLTSAERVLEGIDTMPNELKFNETKTELIAKTQYELFSDGLISTEEYGLRIKAERDKRLQGMDKYTPQYIQGNLTEEQWEKVYTYCAYLREIPQQEGFPVTFTDFEEFVL